LGRREYLLPETELAEQKNGEQLTL